GASWPCAPTLLGQGALCNDDLLFARCLVCGRSELAAAKCLPSGSRELQTSVVAVTGVDVPVATGLALCKAVPVRVWSSGCGWCHQGSSCAESDGGCCELRANGVGLSGVASHFLVFLSYPQDCGPVRINVYLQSRKILLHLSRATTCYAGSDSIAGVPAVVAIKAPAEPCNAL